MIKKIGNFIVDKYLGGLLTGLTIWALKYYSELPPENRPLFFEFTWLSGFLKSPVPVWGVIIGLILLFVFYKIYSQLKKIGIESAKHANLVPDFTNYTIDRFGKNDSLWTWTYHLDVYGSYIMDGLVPCCPDCKTPMQDNYGGVSHCWNCKLQGKPYIKNIGESITDIKNAITHRIKSGSFRNLLK